MEPPSLRHEPTPSAAAVEWLRQLLLDSAREEQLHNLTLTDVTWTSHSLNAMDDVVKAIASETTDEFVEVDEASA